MSAVSQPPGGEGATSPVAVSKPGRFGTTFTSLKEREYAWYFAGNIAFFMGMQMQFVLRGFLGYELTGKATALALVSLAVAIPMLVVTTTHMKQGYHRRNGVPASSKAVTTHWFIRHGTELTIVQFTEDPVYLDEIHVRTTDFQLNPTQNVGPLGLGFEAVDEIATWEPGYVPHYPFGHEPREFSELLGVPFEATQGHAEAMYPEYLPTLRWLMAEMEVADGD
jgi:hypothetical protein